MLNSKKKLIVISIGLMGVVFLLIGLNLLKNKGLKGEPVTYTRLSSESVPDELKDRVKELDLIGFHAMNLDGDTYLYYGVPNAQNYKFELQDVKLENKTRINIKLYSGSDRPKGSIQELGGLAFSHIYFKLDESLNENAKIHLIEYSGYPDKQYPVAKDKYQIDIIK